MTRAVTASHVDRHQVSRGLGGKNHLRAKDLSGGTGLPVRSGQHIGTRVVWIDIARTAAIVCMIVFHFTRDLETFGLVPQGTTLVGGWYVFARLIAASFLFLVGISLVLAHGDGIRWRSFWKRLAMIGGAATVVTFATYLAQPDRFIYFGILHAIAASSVIAVLFVNLPALFPAACALGVWSVAFWWGRSLDLPVWLGWTGLGQAVRPSLDLLPLFPWLACSLLGVSVARMSRSFMVPRAVRSDGTRALLSWPGRNSLAIYLLHQPVLLALIWLAAWAGIFA